MDWLTVTSCRHQFWVLTSFGPTLVITLAAMSSHWMTLSMEFSEVGMENVNVVMGME